MLDLRQFGVRPFNDDIVPAEIKTAAVSFDRNPVAFVDCNIAELRAPRGYVDLDVIAADDAGFSHLPCHQCGMRGAAAKGGDDTGRYGKAGNIGSARIRTYKDDGLAGVSQAFSAG